MRTTSQGTSPTSRSTRSVTRRRYRKIALRHTGPGIGPPTPGPLAAVLLALDAATTTGAALYVRGRLVWYAELDARDPCARYRVLESLQTMGAVHGLPVAIVCEQPFGGHLSAAIALAGIVTLWRDTWRQLAGSPGAFLEHTASTWRHALFGSRSLSRALARQLESRVAQQRAARDMPGAHHYRIGPDAAAAICIGQVMTRSSTLAAAIGCKCERPGR